MKPHPLSLDRRLLATFVLLFAGVIFGLVVAPAEQRAAAPPIPEQLSDEEFWKLSQTLSEEDGNFRSDNLVSNELTFQYIIPDLLKTAQPGRVYLGVGPEQNFTYIAALKPTMAFIVDIRHGNFDVHLLYKALFELSANRAEFVSRLFSRKQPSALGVRSSADELFSEYLKVEPNPELFAANLKAVIDHLKTKRGFPLSAGDLEGIEWAYRHYFNFGPDISYNSSDALAAPETVGVRNPNVRRGGGSFNNVTYATLMTADDGVGLARSYLASEENFMVLKNLQMKNLLVPVVGDFGGAKAIRAVGKYLKSVDAMVSTFYLSNVEDYLGPDGKTPAFLANVATLPIDASSRFIRSGRGIGSPSVAGRGLGSGLGNMLEESRPYAEK